jgi:hypothetical protein
MTRKEFDNLESIKKLYEAEDYATASRYAYTYGIRNKDDEMVKYSNVLMTKAKKIKKSEDKITKDLTTFSEFRF